MSECMEFVKGSQHCAQSLPLLDLSGLPTSQHLSMHSSFMVNFSVAHEHTTLLGLWLPKRKPWKAAGRKLTPSQGTRKTENSLVPPLAQDREVHWNLQRDEGRRTGSLRRTHIGALYLTSSSTSLWHDPLSAPSYFPPVHTYPFEIGIPEAASHFGNCWTSCVFAFACFSWPLCYLLIPRSSLQHWSNLLAATSPTASQHHGNKT